MITVEDWEGREYSGPTLTDVAEEVWGPGARIGRPDQFGHRQVTRYVEKAGATSILDRVRRVTGVEEDPDESLLERVRRLGALRADLTDELREVSAELAEVAVHAVEVGQAKSSVARDARVTRATLDAWIRARG